MIRPVLRAPHPAIFLTAAACSLATGCAFFENLNSDGYREAGTDARQCDFDAGCRDFRVSCGGATCPSGEVCCVSLSDLQNGHGQCSPLSECASQGTSFALCNSPVDCQDAGCNPQSCSFSSSSIEVWACGLLPSPPCTQL